ncbi:NAD(P)-dependent oxidoreductase [Propylenella binzhouense]|uniref:NAD(P)-dependent oxidoreductase n=1 Tax=Propylenella binzhouense TaxID=2555902 RepID=A0A964T3I5_9HYPH|nr:NAD(P)-dependent oxidoreductase [Propylenella binzhouense]MYZ47634.1 NAD(P)-dependent oxidoreductase [Propylenella binzhouense]
MRIGIVGLGAMGKAFADRLAECGHELVVWNRTRAKAEALAGSGAEVAETPAALAGAVEAVISIVTDSEAVEAVYRGPEGLLSGDVAGQLFIEMSTVPPATQMRLSEAVGAKGAAFVECAVSGSVGPARQGRLIGLAGGSAEAVARARPILDCLCRRVEHIGPAGSGASVKLTVNLPLMLYFQALGEAYALSRHLGVDTAWLIDLLADTTGGPNLLKARGPAIATALAGEEPPPSFTVETLLKDLRTMIGEADRLGYGLPLAESALAVYEDAARSGWAGRDAGTLAAYWPSITRS